MEEEQEAFLPQPKPSSSVQRGWRWDASPGRPCAFALFGIVSSSIAHLSPASFISHLSVFSFGHAACVPRAAWRVAAMSGPRRTDPHRFLAVREEAVKLLICHPKSPVSLGWAPRAEPAPQGTSGWRTTPLLRACCGKVVPGVPIWLRLYRGSGTPKILVLGPGRGWESWRGVCHFSPKVMGDI